MRHLRLESAGPDFPRRSAFQAVRYTLRVRSPRRVPGTVQREVSAAGLLYRLLLLCEWLTFHMAEMVISTNETFRELAIGRGGKNPEHVMSVYSFPDRAKLHRVPPNEKLRRGRKIVLGYVGIIGFQDGVDHLIRATHHIVRDLGCTDVQTLIVGDGTAVSGLRDLVADLKMEDHITFTGYLRGEDLLEALSSFDIGVIPDPYNEFNDKVSMNKAFEYGLLGIPTVTYRLKETMRMLGDAAIYANCEGPNALGGEILKLIADPDLRTHMGRRALERADKLYDWDREAIKYVAVFEKAISGRRRIAHVPTTAEVAF